MSCKVSGLERYFKSLSLRILKCPSRSSELTFTHSTPFFCRPSSCQPSCFLCYFVNLKFFLNSVLVLYLVKTASCPHLLLSESSLHSSTLQILSRNTASIVLKKWKCIWFMWIYFKRPWMQLSVLSAIMNPHWLDSPAADYTCWSLESSFYNLNHCSGNHCVRQLNAIYVCNYILHHIDLYTYI